MNDSVDKTTHYQVIDDGHKPSHLKNADLPTKLAVQTKSLKSFLNIRDNVLPQQWTQKAYKYSQDFKKPWGITY